jgi:CBS domain containing-hemolysin-like protein
MSVGQLALVVVLLATNAFFVAFEFSLVASRRSRLEQLAANGNRRAQMALHAIGELGLQIAGVQLGVTVASLGLGAVAEPAAASLLEGAFGHLLPHGAAVVVGFACGLTIVVFLHTVLGELVPKSLAIARAESMLLLLAAPMRLFLIVFGPLVRVLDGLATLVLKALRVERRTELMSAGTAEELALMFRQSTQRGLIDEPQGELLAGTFGLDRRVADVMVPRERIEAVSERATVAEVEAAALSTGHSRLPVYRRNLDDVIGYIHVKDLLHVPLVARSRPVPARFVRRLLLVRDERMLGDVLVAMQKARLHVALVRDRDGRTTGLVTLENVLEQLVGQISDETDR